MASEPAVGAMVFERDARNGGSFSARFLEPAVLSFTESGISLVLEQTPGDTEEESMQSAVWSAACTLAGAMQHPAAFAAGHWHGRTILELGSGCGACGIMAARLGARQVFLTDLQPLLPLLERNARSNGVEGQVVVRPLEWGDSKDLQGFPPIDVIIGSDITTFIQSLGVLESTITLLATERTEVIIAHQHRGSDASFFFDEFSRRFVCEELPPLPDTLLTPGADIRLYRLRKLAQPLSTIDVSDEDAIPEDVLAAAIRGDVRALKQRLLINSRAVE